MVIYGGIELSETAISPPPREPKPGVEQGVMVPPPPGSAMPVQAKGPRRRVYGMPSEAPRLVISYVCPICQVVVLRDAYDGPPYCLGDANAMHRAWMRPTMIVEV